MYASKFVISQNWKKKRERIKRKTVGTKVERKITGSSTLGRGAAVLRIRRLRIPPSAHTGNLDRTERPVPRGTLALVTEAVSIAWVPDLAPAVDVRVAAGPPLVARSGKVAALALTLALTLSIPVASAQGTAILVAVNIAI